MPEAIAIDASVAVKWFKKGERGEAEALRLRDAIFTAKTDAIAPAWLLLEVVRALVKVNYPREKIEDAYSALKDASSLGLIEITSATELLDKAKTLAIELKLFASDAIYLSAALTHRINLVTDDSHLLKESVQEYAVREGIRILPLQTETPKRGSTSRADLV